jgi:anti-sigma-K factor RskA
MNLEDELRKALLREEPPAGFAERVLARAAAQADAPAHRWWRLPRMRLAAVAACAVLLALAGAGYRQWQGEMAKQRTLVALGIAGGELRATQIRVRHILAERAGATGETGARMEDR